MKKFLVRICNVAIIAVVLIGYNQAARAHEASDLAAKAEADAANAQAKAAYAALEDSEGTGSGEDSALSETDAASGNQYIEADGTSGDAYAGKDAASGDAYSDGGSVPSYIYADGTYQGTGVGFGGDILVEVTIEDGMITDISIVSAANEDGAYLSAAEKIIDDIIQVQSTDVDTVTGATFSSTGIKNAVSEALKAAGSAAQ